MSFNQYYSTYSQRIAKVLDQHLPEATQLPERLHSAMRYAVLNGGKRLRPLLVYATGEMLGTPLSHLDAAACAVELLHAYSLIHDDLPAMDNDDWRRGQPTCHKAFDEATAILAGNALQTLAFAVLTKAKGLTAKQRLLMLQTLTSACGSTGLLGGQMLDIQASGSTITLAELETIHRAKTGALICASVKLALLAANAATAVQERLEDYAAHIGLAFQIQDDVLDVASDNSINANNAKPGYPALLGLAKSEQRVSALYQHALACLEPWSPSNPLTLLTQHMAQRTH